MTLYQKVDSGHGQGCCQYDNVVLSNYGSIIRIQFKAMKTPHERGDPLTNIVHHIGFIRPFGLMIRLGLVVKGTGRHLGIATCNTVKPDQRKREASQPRQSIDL